MEDRHALVPAPSPLRSFAAALLRRCAPSPLRSFAALSGLILLALCPSPNAQAQGTQTDTYIVSYTGGKTTAIGSTDFPTGPYTPASAPNQHVPAGNAYGGSASNHQISSGNSVTVNCKGAVTATFTWNGGPNNDSAPAAGSVIVVEQVNAGWNGQTGSVGSDLPGGTTSGSPASQTYAATRYSVKGGGSFTATCTPTASASSTAPPGGSSGVSVNMGYTATAYPVTINLAGTTKDSSGNLNILVGQGCTASLVGIPSNCTTSNYNWTVPGVTFQRWTASPSSAVRDPIAGQPGYGSPTQPTIHWFWSDAAAGETVTCTATVTPPPNMGPPFSVNLTQTVYLQSPDIIENNTSGVVHLDNGASAVFKSPYALFLGPQIGTMGRGITWAGQVNTPSPFSSQGPGTWQFAQIITPTASRTPSGGTAQASSNNGLSGCDGAYPYGGGAYFADNSPHNTGDTPGFGIQDTYTSYQVTQTFKTYVMYQPPPAAQANGVMWVPLWEIDWNWTAAASQTGGWATWPVGKSPGSLTITSSQKQQTVHPIWSMQVTPPAIW